MKLVYIYQASINLKTPAVGLTQVERSQIHTHLPRRWSCLCSTDGQSMGPEIAQLLTATSLHSKKDQTSSCFTFHSKSNFYIPYTYCSHSQIFVWSVIKWTSLKYKTQFLTKECNTNHLSSVASWWFITCFYSNNCVHVLESCDYRNTSLLRWHQFIIHFIIHY